MVVNLKTKANHETILDLAPSDAKKYFAEQAKKIVKTVNNAKELVQELTIDAMAHAEKHGDWTSSLLPIMEVMLTQGSGKEATHGPFGQQMGLAYASYITKFTKLVYNPKGLNGRKLSKLAVQDRWQWDKTKLFDVEQALRVKWWTIGRTTQDREEADYLDSNVFDQKINRFIVSIQKIINETDGLTEDMFDDYKAKLMDRVGKLKYEPNSAKSATKNSANGDNTSDTHSVNEEANTTVEAA